MKFDYEGRTFEIEGMSGDDHIYRQIVSRRSFYELDLLAYLRGLLSFCYRPGAIAVDVGANIGNHSIFMGAFLADHVLAIEPNPAVVPILTRNLERNIDNFTLHAVAMGEEAGQGSIAMPDHSGGNVGMARVVPGNDVPVSTLDALVAGCQLVPGQDTAVSLIKIDVEGMELAVLKGARRTLETWRPHLVVEASTLADLDRLTEFLSPFGYVKLSRWGATPVYHFAAAPGLALVLTARTWRPRKKLGALLGREKSA